MVDQVKSEEPNGAGDAPAIGELRTLPLSRIKVVDGFNPRGGVERAQIDQLACSIAERGMLQPVLVQPADEDGEYPLTDGNRRVLAAAQAGLMEIPALIRETDERTGGLDDALIANLGAIRLNPLEEALGFRRLGDARLTPREIAHRVPGMSERLVRERLRILDLPAELWPKVADKTIPLGAVEALASLAAIHPGLPSVAVGRVVDGPVEQWDAPTTWDDIMTDPISVVVGRYERQIDDLPSDVYVGGHSYPVDRFELDEKGARDLEKLCGFLPGVEPEDFTVRFDRVDEARALGAAHTSASGYETLIVGQDVANQLAGDYIAACLKVQRANARRTATPDVPEDASTPDEPADPAEAEATRKEAARRERAEAKAAQEAAAARNEELGLALVKHLSKVKVDARVLKILTCADVSAQIGKIAMRGARYGFPGWVEQTERKSGGVKRSYLPAGAAEAKALEYLAGARTATEIAGRTLALMAMARHADEKAVAQSQRSFFDMRFAGYVRGLRGPRRWPTSSTRSSSRSCPSRSPRRSAPRAMSARRSGRRRSAASASATAWSRSSSSARRR
ncbi:MAG TPA: ParB/RepB/Spo0J family partition protein [Solirubrobacteraceae bacterium]|jgi:ParB/RepB/Spo0J family partition protein